MLTETGRVVALEEDAVWVETVRGSNCGQCAARSGCGHGSLSTMFSGKGLIRAVATEQLSASELRLNDEVLIELPENAVLAGAITVYVLPLLLAMLASASLQGFGEWYAVTGFVAALTVAFLSIRVLQHWWHLQHYFEPRLAARRSLNEGLIARS